MEDSTTTDPEESLNEDDGSVGDDKEVLEMTRKTEGSLGLSWEEWRMVEDNIDEGQQN